MNILPKNAFQTQRLIVFASVFLFALKFLAWHLTSSVAILTDALESTVNVVAGFLGLYSVYLSSQPKDPEHPYGHGKVEFITSAVEGILVALAGFLIMYEAVDNFLHPHDIKHLDLGLTFVGISALVNYVLGVFSVKKGNQIGSPVLIASGEHLKSDTYSTLGLMLGILALWITGYAWIDSAVALVFSFWIVWSGYKIVRSSVSGIMDESDEKILHEIAGVLQKERLPEWVDVHNMRVINYAGFYHIDCHLTVPFYVNVHASHRILDALTEVLKKHFADRVEFFIHVDGCLDFQCAICSLPSCPERKQVFAQKIAWTAQNLTSNEKHRGE